MVNPDRPMLHELVEADETEVPLRSKHDPIAHHGIPNVGKVLIIGAVELDEVEYPQRLRLESLSDKAGPSVRGFIGRAVGRGATVVSDRSLRAPPRPQGRRQHGGPRHPGMDPPGVSNLKRWFLGTLHGVRKQRLGRYLDEFVFRWNRRRHTRTRRCGGQARAAVWRGCPCEEYCPGYSGTNAPSYLGQSHRR